MHVLFYLPVVTPWWFDAIVAPIIRIMARDATVSVLVPPLWRGTGIGPEQLTACADLEMVDWYILDGEDHPKLRTSAADEAELIALVRDIGADLILCRSADLATPELFPGIVRFIMEGAAPPFATDPATVWLPETLFDHGMMPAIDPAARARLDALFRPSWDEARARFGAADRDGFLAQAGLPQGKRLIGLPLEYEHEEMFFGQHYSFASNIDLVNAIADQLDDDMILAVTNHPLNEMHCDNAPLHAAIAARGGTVRMVPAIGAPGGATMMLARYGDGMIVGNSKSFGGCAFFGTPMLRLSRFRTGGWMHAYDGFAPFAADIRAGMARAADPADALSWFALHLIDHVFDPATPGLTAADLIDRVTRPVDERRWEAGAARLAGHRMSEAA
ncbi:MAG: hypothetical protein JWN66_3129 [Sphingomonas bacterium]|uniref:hypothetical protein n=1 Tax=Sphingomonas bacterium TaxID=1895847 RepID=UPI002613F25C|nr:hypothetical protein [Sphingomonas bacterium]MDB5706013.1 hypothetical protein [Sphingomonas bacterium]